MHVEETALPGVLVLEPKVFGDERGFFLESFNVRTFRELTGLDVDFVQDNHSRSRKGVLRGLHYQIQQPQGKLVRVVRGETFNVAVDVRRSSPTRGKWFGTHLSESNQRELWIPVGFAHGFLVVSESADVVYKTTDYWAPAHERSILWNDADLAIAWPDCGEVILSGKDAAAVAFKNAELFA